MKLRISLTYFLERISLTQYIPNKPGKFNINLWWIYKILLLDIRFSVLYTMDSEKFSLNKSRKKSSRTILSMNYFYDILKQNFIISDNHWNWKSHIRNWQSRWLNIVLKINKIFLKNLLRNLLIQRKHFRKLGTKCWLAR